MYVRRRLGLQIPAAQEVATRLKEKARALLTVTVAEAHGLVDEGAFGGEMSSFAQITVAAKEYDPAKGHTFTTLRSPTLEGAGNHPKWGKDTADLEFDEHVEVEDDGILIVEIFEDDCGTEELVGEATVTIKEVLQHNFDGEETGEWRINLKNDKKGAISAHKQDRTLSAVKNRFLRQKQGDKKTKLSVVEALQFSGGTHGFGQVLLKFSWEHPADENKTAYKEAMTKLKGAKQRLQDTKNEKRALNGEKGSDELHRPEEVAKCVLVHVFAAQNLPGADSNGSADPYLKASIMGAEARTSAKAQTLFPFWYETLALKAEFPKDLDYFDAGLVAPLLLQLYDRDTLSGDDFMGFTEIPLKGVTDKMPAQPTWHPIKLAESDEVAGRVLVKLQIVDLEDLSNVNSKISRPIEVIKPTMRKCTIEFFLLGCRHLQPKNHIKPQAPFVTCKLNGDGNCTRCPHHKLDPHGCLTECMC